MPYFLQLEDKPRLTGLVHLALKQVRSIMMVDDRGNVFPLDANLTYPPLDPAHDPRPALSRLPRRITQNEIR